MKTADYQQENEPNWPLLGALRFFLAAVVFNEHIRLVGGDRSLSEVFGYGAVASFFVISGFSMAHSLGKGSKGFYERRFYRIWPLYIFSLAVALIPMLRGSGFYVWPYGGMNELPDTHQIVVNALMLQPLLSWPLGTNGPTWSLGVEAAFYVVVPFYARLNAKVRFIALACSVLFSLVVTHQTKVPLQEKGFIWPYFGMFWLFAMGYELFRYRYNVRAKQAALALPMVLSTAGYATITMACSLLLIINQSEIKLTPKWQRIFIYLGELSYPLYILHDPTMAIVNQAWPKCPIPLYYVAGLLAAVAAYHLIDKPIRGWHRKRNKKDVPNTLDGLPNRADTHLPAPTAAMGSKTTS